MGKTTESKVEILTVENFIEKVQKWTQEDWSKVFFSVVNSEERNEVVEKIQAEGKVALTPLTVNLDELKGHIAIVPESEIKNLISKNL